MMINKIALKVNPSTSQHKCWGLPFDKLKALSTAEGLRVDPERRFFTPPSKAGLGAVEWVNPALERALHRISIEIWLKIIYVDIII